MRSKKQNKKKNYKNYKEHRISQIIYQIKCKNKST